MANKINKISAEVLLNIKKKSALALPNNPSASGLSPNAIKQAFAGFVVDSQTSSLAEQERIINEVNEIFKKMFVGIYEELPTDLTIFENEDKIMLVDGSIYKFSGGVFTKTNILIDELKATIEELIDDGIVSGLIETDIINKLNTLFADYDNQLESMYVEKETTYAPRLTNLEVNKADKTELQAVASGSPKGVFPTLLDLETAFPAGDNNIYINAANGYWYYWDGSMWVDGGVYQSTGIADKSVTLDKTTFSKLSSNLHNSSKVKEDVYIQWWDGNEVTDSSFRASYYTMVEPQQNYYLLCVNHMTFFDSDKNYISGYALNEESSHDHVFTTPANAKYIRYSWGKTYISEPQQLNKGTEKLPYEDYYEVIDKNYIEKVPFDISDLPRQSISYEHTNFITEGKNLFDKEKSEVGYYVNQVYGNMEANSAYTCSDYISIEGGATYTFSKYSSGQRVAFYDSSKKYISGTLDGGATFTVPSNAKYLRFSFESYLGKDEQQLEKGTARTAYEPYGLKLANSLLEKIEKTNNEKDLISIFLPSEICVAVGRTIELYNNQVALCGNVNNFHFKWDCQIGKSMKRKFSVEGLANQLGEYPLSLTVYDNNRNVVAQASTTLKIVSNTLINSKSLLTIGDSLTNNKAWLNELKTLSNGQLSLVGTRGTLPLKHEGRSGFSANSYLTGTAYTYESEGIHPFWDGSRFNWNHYKTNTGINPDAIQIYLGTNGMAIDPTTNANNIKQIIDYIRQDDANIPIFVVFTLFRANQNGLGVQTSVDGYSANKGAWKFEEDAKVFNLMVRLNELLKDYTNLHFVPISLCHDSEFNFGNVETPVNPRAVQKEYLPVEATHPQLQGYLQMADIMFSVMVKYLNS